MRLRLGILVVLLVLIVGSLACVGGLALSRHGNPFSSVDKTQRERDAVMAQARQFMLRVNTYGPDLLQGKTMPKYRQRIEDVITAKFRTDFEQNVPYAEATVAGNQAGRSAKVFQTGVAAIDDDTATVLVAGQLTVTLPQKGSKKPVVAGRELFRVNVDLVKTHGSWLVDNWGPTEKAPAGSGSTGVAQ